MEEKYMVNDALECIKNELLVYEKAILECENNNLIQEIQKIRNSQENFLYELFKIAQLKNYCSNNLKVKKEDIDIVKKELNC